MDFRISAPRPSVGWPVRGLRLEQFSEHMHFVSSRLQRKSQKWANYKVQAYNVEFVMLTTAPGAHHTKGPARS